MVDRVLDASNSALVSPRLWIAPGLFKHHAMAAPRNGRLKAAIRARIGPMDQPRPPRIRPG